MEKMTAQSRPDAGSNFCPLSEWRQWQDLRTFYDQAGPEAWRSAVPSLATNNRVLAHAYAEVVIGLMRDVTEHKTRPACPFIILELGAGTGEFTFHFLTALTQLQMSYGYEHVPFGYVMTDFTESNINVWRSQPGFAPYVEAGFLDFALLDSNKATDVQLQCSNKSLRGP